MAGIREFQTEKCCPKCGRAFDNVLAKDDISLTFNTLAHKGNKIHLTPRETKIIECLLKSAPAVVNREYLFSYVWSVNTDGKILDVYICALRKKLKGLKIDIMTDWGIGYKLVAK